jgi:hypothetical protein
MTLQEFAKLKAGDRIRNDMTQSTGEVTEATRDGVKVRWGAAGGPEFHFSANSTGWFHWSNVGEVEDSPPRS